MRRSSVSRCLAIVLSSSVLCSIPARSYAQEPPVLTLADGRTVEVLGLRRWTIGMLQDSLARYAPSDSLQSHACAAVLRYKLHFADASSVTFSSDSGEPDAIVVSVREPQDSARVHYRNLPLDSLNSRKEWREITDVFRLHQNIFWTEVRQHVGAALGPKRRYHNAGDSVLAARFTSTLNSFRRKTDLRDALQSLASRRVAGRTRRPLAQSASTCSFACLLRG